MSQKIKKSLIFLSFIVLSLLFSFHFTRADIGGEGGKGIMEGARTETTVEAPSLITLMLTGAGNLIIALLTTSLQTLLVIANACLSITVGLLIWVTHPDFISLSYTNPAGNPLLATGWALVRNLTNMGFVISFAFIGLATALRIKEYQAQKTLLPLILMALLVNFTPVILGVIVDASNILMNFLLGEVVSFQFIADMWETQGNIVLQQLKALVGSTINYKPLAATIALIIFAGTTSFIITLYTLLFLFRYVAIWILVILSPLAFFSYVLPATRKIWQHWWNQFLQWCFIGVTMAFFLYLGNHLLAAATEGEITGILPSSEEAGGLIETLLPYGMVIVLLIYGLLMSLSTSAVGASYAIKGAKGAAGVAMGATAAAGAAIARRGKTWAREKVPKEWREKAEEWAKAPVPGTGERTIGGALKRTVFGLPYFLRQKVTAPLTTKAESEEIKKAEKEVEDATTGEILTKIRREGSIAFGGSRSQVVGWFRDVIKRPREKGIDKIIEEGLSGAEIQDILNKAKDTGTDAYKDIVKILAETAPLVNPTIRPAEAREGVISRIKPEVVRRMSRHSLMLQKNLDAIIKYMGSAHMREIEDVEVLGEINRTMNEKFEEIKNREIKKGQSDKGARILAFREMATVNRDLLRWRLTSSQAQASPHHKHEILTNLNTGRLYTNRQLKIIFDATVATPPTKPPFPTP